MGARTAWRGLAWPSIRTAAGAPMFDSAEEIREVVAAPRSTPDVRVARLPAQRLRVVPAARRRTFAPAPRAGALRFTAFQSDADDRAHRVWDKVFFNLGDFGRPFAWGRRAIPNVYGPITLQFAPGALSEATDVAICLRSASSPRASTAKPRAYGRRMRSSSSSSSRWKSGSRGPTDIKYGDSLRSSFPFAKDARRPEMLQLLHDIRRRLLPRSRCQSGSTLSRWPESRSRTG